MLPIVDINISIMQRVPTPIRKIWQGYFTEVLILRHGFSAN